MSLPANATQFETAFREFLITKMVQGGKQVLTTPNPQALEVSYQTQVVRHNSPRPHFIPGGFTMLAGGLIAAYGLRNQHMDTHLVAALAGTGALDYANSINSGGPTATELILTTTVTRGGQYVARKTDVYYLENVDAPLFVNTAMIGGLSIPLWQLGGAMGDLLRHQLEPEVYRRMKDAGFPMVPYVNHWGTTPEKGWDAYLEGPRYLSGYGAVRNIYSFVPETHMLKPFAQRYEATYNLLRLALEQTAAQQKALLAARAAAKVALEYLKRKQEDAGEIPEITAPIALKEPRIGR